MRASLCIVAALFAAGCLKKSEKYCALHDDPAHCPAPDAPVGPVCDDNTDCAAPTPVCDSAGSKTCVGCVMDSDCTAQATAPVCGDAHTCGGCRVHEDCASEACMPDGSCAAMGDVAYVDTVMGTGAGVCTKMNPCLKVSQGIASLKKVIKLTGVNDEGVSIDNRADGITLLGATGAQLVRNNGVILDIKGSTSLVVVGVTIGPNVDTFTTGVSLSAASTATVELRRVRLQHNSSGAVRVQDGTIRMFDSTLYSNSGGGISVSSSALGFVIRNNFIISNGRSSGVTPTGTGGALIEADVGGTFEYNTVAYNGSSGLNRAGVHCEGPSNHAANNIVVGNTEMANGTNDGTQINTNTPCGFGNTVKAGNGAPLMFVAYAADPPDLHLTAASPGTVLDAAGDCAATVPTDVDRQPRPYGAACDVGADEYQP